MSDAPQISLGQKLGIPIAFGKALAAALIRMTTSPFKGSKGGPTYYRDVFMTLVRTQLRNVSIEQTQYTSKPTGQVYLDFATANKFTPMTDDLGNGGKAHWLGDKSAKVTLVYLHGGGYVVPAGPNHFSFLYDLMNALNNSGASLNICFLEYTLAPHGEYPTQLRQASSLITHLLTTKSAADLIVAGDSAGGNLILGLLSHLLHPHPAIPAVDLKGDKLRGAVLLSPWVSFDTRHPSYTTNAESDLFDEVPLNTWARAFLGASMRRGILMGDSYSEPLIAEPGWWGGAHKVVDEVLIWGGGGEIFIDGILAFSDKFTEGWKAGGGDPRKVQTISRARMCHEEPLADILMGFKEKGEGAKDIETFVRSKL
ncbi:uncharacterized protein PV09_04984 [Verruconis gallopava]|uniref:Alpha/beta hydrolase fold-3 domain-containing protein n=1 Tax=Verruconis gallopava TaxID=253628 RepID=A0A0D1YSP8_9PEZI|nr:uncharacterized protein PV09_04984 [Verruconis gallopava]KIW03662.1 hypothetical protein PV09_04984 [Verruconis gallopava]